jgi:hypothetical protein
MHDDATQRTTRLLARIVRTLLATEHFDTLADLVAAVKDRCGRLRIRFTPDDLTAGLTVVASNTPLLLTQTPATLWPPPEVEVVSRADAVAILQRLGVTVDGSTRGRL